MSTKGFADMLSALTSAMPGWTSFEDPRLQSREIRYKREASKKARETLGRDVMEQLISRGHWDEILKRLEDIGKLTNLLWNRVPQQGDMAILFTETLDKESYCKQVFDLLHGADDPMVRFERYIRYVREHDLPNRWPFPTYLLFLFHPETEFYVKPSVAKWFLQQAGEGGPWSSQPSVELYATLKNQVRRFGEYLSSYSPTDMIDLQSAIYMASYEIPRMQKVAVWWVNQGTTYRAAREGGFLWAPLRNRAGRTEYHWETMAEVRPGDIVLHYSNNAVRAVSRITEAATIRPAPREIANGPWESEGRYVKAEYTHFDQPIPIETVTQHQETRSIPRGPINASGAVKQGYLFPFTIEALAKVVASAPVEWPSYVKSVVESPNRGRPSSSWLFQANPDRYDVMGAISNLDELTWTVHQYANKVQAGDTAYIWQSGKDAGVVAVAKVLSSPETMTRLDEEERYFLDKSLSGAEPALRVRVRVERVLSNRVTRQQFRDHPVLSQVSILKQAQGTVFPLTDEQAAALDALLTGAEVTRHIIRVGVPLTQCDSFLTEGYLSIGWPEVGDLRQYASQAELAQAVETHLAEQFSTERQRDSVTQQLWLFRSLLPGDEVIATHGTSAVLAIGRVLDPGYTWDGAEDGLGHLVRVQWDESVAQRVTKQPQWRAAVVEVADEELTAQARKPGPGLPRPAIDLAAVCEQFASALKESNLRFGARHDEVVRTFVTSLATKRFVILTGLSGSGKTQIAVRFGEWLGEGRSRVVAVRPDWTGSEALFGYEDALQEPKDGRRPWHVPEALEFMLKAARDPEHPYLLVLDEMNLAHVERYFADALSGMESDQAVLPNLVKGKDGLWRLDPDGPERIAIPENLFVVGTVNVDETTYMFSPKVLDRANTIEFRVDSDDLSEVVRRPVPLQSGDPDLVRGFLFIATDEDWHVTQPGVNLTQFTKYLRKLHRLLADSHVQFGHRVVYEANRFASLLAAAGIPDLMVALDLQVLQKVLPRVHGSRKRLEPVLRALAWFCYYPDAEGGEEEAKAFDFKQLPQGEPKLPRTFHKLQRMMRNLEADQFTSFAE